MEAKPTYEELKRQIGELKESQDRYRTMIEASPVAIMAMRDGCLLFSNPAGVRMLGFSHPDEMVGTPVIDVVAPESQQRVIERIQRLESGEDNPTEEIMLIRQDGVRITLESTSVTVNIDGLPTAVIIAQDISERKELEMKLKESEERFRAFMDNNPASIYIKDENDSHIYANQEACKSTRKKLDELIGSTTRDLWPPQIADRLIELDRKVLHGDSPRVTEEWSSTEEGKKLWRRDIKFPIKLASGKKLLGGIAIDITDIKENEQRLQMVQYSTDNALDRIAWIAPDGRFLYANEAACREMGYTLAEVLSMGVFDIDPNFPVEMWTEHYKDLKKRGSMRLETQQTSKDGQIHDIEVSTNYLKFGDREFLCSFGRDITERKKADKDLRKALDEISVLKDQLEKENIFLREEIKLSYRHEEIVGESDAIKSMLSQAEKVADQKTCVLIQGETGTGKELLARAIHRMSPRGNRQMITVNCGALPGTLIENEMFGREKGAFTGAVTKEPGRFEIADGSTIFLDEIGDLPVEVQSKLLRVLEKGSFERLGSSETITVDVRVIAATHYDLRKLTQEGRFRKDLFYRLSGFPITVPPLRERREDIPLLVWAFVKEFGERMGKKINTVSGRTMTLLKNYLWPGNIRELRNVIERGMILTSDSILRIDRIETAEPSSAEDLTLADVEKRHILKILDNAGWRVSGKNGAAEVLGLKESTLRARMKKLGIKRQK